MQTVENRDRVNDRKQRLLLEVKVGIVKQLFKDNMITATQYRFLLAKYGKIVA